MIFPVRKLVASAEQFVIHLLCIILLAKPHAIGNGSERLIMRIEAKAEDIGHLVMKLRADLHGCENWHLFLRSQLQDTGNRIDTVVISNRNQAKASFGQI